MGILSVPLKTVIMYHADATNETIPASYEICDGRTLTAGTHDIGGGAGSYTLPNLLNRFILGADITKGAGVVGGLTDAAADAPGPKGIGGLNGLTLITANLPAHTHTGTSGSAGSHNHAGSSVASAGAHTHAGSTSDSSGSHNHAITMGIGGPPVTVGNGPNQNTNSYPISSGFGYDNSNSWATTAAAGTHSHNLTIVSDGSHTHTVTIASDGAHTHTFTTDVTGSGTTVDNRPRYYGLVFLMKVRN